VASPRASLIILENKKSYGTLDLKPPHCQACSLDTVPTELSQLSRDICLLQTSEL
jgi:hypothetical protein